MAITASWFHAAMDVISRSDGRGAVGIAAYVTGKTMKDAELDKWCKRNHPGDVHAYGTTVPEYAPAWLTDKQNLSKAWNAAQAAETRINSQLARHWNIALSREFDKSECIAVMEDIARKITDRYGVMTTWAVHDPTGHGDGRNNHGHIVHNMRQLTPDGFGPKAREMVAKATSRKEMLWMRGMIADTINEKLERHGSLERVSHETYKARGIDRKPMRHLGNTDNQLELRGVPTPTGDYNRQILEERTLQAARDMAEIQQRMHRDMSDTVEPVRPQQKQDRIPSADNETAQDRVMFHQQGQIKVMQDQKERYQKWEAEQVKLHQQREAEEHHNKTVLMPR